MSSTDNSASNLPPIQFHIAVIGEQHKHMYIRCAVSYAKYTTYVCVCSELIIDSNSMPTTSLPFFLCVW